MQYKEYNQANKIILWLVKTWAKDTLLGRRLKLVRFSKKIVDIVVEVVRSPALPTWPVVSVLGVGGADGELRSVITAMAKARQAFLASPDVKLARDEAGKRGMWGNAKKMLANLVIIV